MALVRPITGMSEHDVLWNLPLCRGLAYMHAAMVMNGSDMVWSGDGEEDTILQKARDLIKNKPWRN